MRSHMALLLSVFLSAPAPAQVIDFEDLTVPAAGYYNGSDGAGGFTSRGARFNNSYSAQFGAWSGWSFSRVTNVTTPGFSNQYAAYNLPSGTGDASPTYGVAFNANPGDATVQLPAGTHPVSVRLTNTTYAALSMLNGDQFAKKFGGPTGNDPDFFRLTIQGRDAAGALLGSVEFFLADYRFANNALDYVVSQWTTVNLAGLPATTARLTFALDSTDNGPFGMNTPAYFAVDNLVVAPVPEPGAFALMAVGMVGGFATLRRRMKDATAPRR
jgi:Domain of unknown function (DUF4465)/PEP-CTERM motif